MINEGLLVARLLLGIPFLYWGYGKLKGGDASLVPVLTAMKMHDAKFLARMVGVCEFAGGAMLVVGYPVQTAGLLLGLWCVATALVAHRDDVGELMSHGAMAGGYFALASVGGGSIAMFGGHPPGIFAYLS